MVSRIWISESNDIQVNKMQRALQESFPALAHLNLSFKGISVEGAGGLGASWRGEASGLRL